jgi:hypothetical protein
MKRLVRWVIACFRWLFTPGVPGTAVSIQMTAHYASGTAMVVQQGGKIMLMLRDDQKVSLSIQPLDAKGNPAKVDGVPTWNNSDEAIGTLAAAPDGFSAVYTAMQTGVAQVSVSADADLGMGVRTISGTLDIQIEPGEAVSLGITAGVPAAQ